MADGMDMAMTSREKTMRRPSPPAIGVRQIARGVLGRFDILTLEEDPPPALAAFKAIAGDLTRDPRGIDARANRGSGGVRVVLVWLRIDDSDAARWVDGSPIALASMLGRLPECAWEHLRSGRARLILDWSHEGRPVAAGLLGLGRILASCGIRPMTAILLTQNQSLRHFYCHRLPEGSEPISIVVTHSLLSQYWARLFLQHRVNERQDHEIGFAVLGDTMRRYRYICLNYHLRPARALVVSRLLQRAEPGWISFDTNRLRRDSSSKQSRFYQTLRQLSLPDEYNRNESMVRDLLDRGLHIQSDIESFERPNQGVFQMPAAAFRDSELYIVTETEMSNRNLRRLTEKTLKAIVAGIPFVVFGNPGTISTLSEIGFDTLEDFIDHSYDEIEEPARRVAAAWRAVEKFLARPPGFTGEEMQRLRAAANHNRTVFELQLPVLWILRPLTEIAARAR